MAQRRTDYQDDEIVGSSGHVKLVDERCVLIGEIASLMIRKDMTSREALDDLLARHHPPIRRSDRHRVGQGGPPPGRAMCEDPTVVDIVGRARSGDPAAWSELVERYAPLVWAVCRRNRLTTPDAEEVGQNVWLALLSGLSDLEEPAALPGWLATTTRRECLRLLGNEQRGRTEIVPDAASMDFRAAHRPNGSLPVEERNTILRAAFAQLSEACRRLLALLAQEPPPSYAEIGACLGVPVGRLGPNRARCLEELRRYPPLASLIAADAGLRDGGAP